MWIIKSIVNDNDGTVRLLYPQNGGFGILITFPVKFIRSYGVNKYFILYIDRKQR